MDAGAQAAHATARAALTSHSVSVATVTHMAPHPWPPPWKVPRFWPVSCTYRLTSWQSRICVRRATWAPALGLPRRRAAVWAYKV